MPGVTQFAQFGIIQLALSDRNIFTFVLQRDLSTIFEDFNQEKHLMFDNYYITSHIITAKIITL